MSIDAKIVGVSKRADGSYSLALEDRDSQSCAGQSVLYIVNQPNSPLNRLSVLIDCEIWGGASELLVGDKKFADRESYSRILLDKNWYDHVCMWQQSKTKQ